MNFTILCIGKLKEEYWKGASAEYLKRLSRFGKCEVIELAESKTDSKDEESAELLNHIPKSCYTIALDVGGKSMSSEELSEKIDALASGGVSHICFIIGGSNGFNDDVRKAADMRLSFSAFTFPHQLMRVILLEQIYRACKISAGEKYHK